MNTRPTETPGSPTASDQEPGRTDPGGAGTAGTPVKKPQPRLPVLEAGLLAAVAAVLLWGHPARTITPATRAAQNATDGSGGVGTVFPGAREPATRTDGGTAAGTTAPTPTFHDARPLLTAPPAVAVATATVRDAVPPIPASTGTAGGAAASGAASAVPAGTVRTDPAPSGRVETAAARVPAAPVAAVAAAAPAAALAGPPTGPGSSIGPGPGTPAAIPAPRPAAPANCSAPAQAPAIAIAPLDSGRMRLAITAACHANQDVRISYDVANLVRRLSPTGTFEMAFDLFAGARKSIEVVFADNARRVLPAVGHDLERVSKVAVIWRAPVNLDLHVFEYGAAGGQAGHIWERASSSALAARARAAEDKRGRGFLSSSDNGRAQGDKLEVYTFLHHDEPMNGAIAMALDYESRGELPRGAMCGTGELAKVDYRIATLSRTGAVSRASSTLRALDCEVPIPVTVRFDAAALPIMRVRN